MNFLCVQTTGMILGCDPILVCCVRCRHITETRLTNNKGKVLRWLHVVLLSILKAERVVYNQGLKLTSMVAVADKLIV